MKMIHSPAPPTPTALPILNSKRGKLSLLRLQPSKSSVVGWKRNKIDLSR